MTRSRILALLLTAAPLGAAAIEPELHAEATLGFDTNPLREAGGEQGVYPFLGAIVEAGVVHGGERTRLRASISEGARLFSDNARDADMLASRLDLDAAWMAGDQGEAGATLVLRDLSERGGVRSETGGSLRLRTRVRLDRFDVESSAGITASYPRTSRLEDFTSAGPDAGVDVGFSPWARQRLRLGWELRARKYPKWPDEDRWDVANGMVLDWSRRGALIAGAGYGFTVNQSSVPNCAYLRHRFWLRLATALPWDLTLAAQGSLQFSNYPGGLAADGERFLAENDEQENAVEVRLSRPIARDFEAALKLAAYGGELSSGTGDRLGYRREVVQLSIGWRPE